MRRAFVLCTLCGCLTSGLLRAAPQQPVLAIDTSLERDAVTCDGEDPPLASPRLLHGKQLTWPLVVNITRSTDKVVARGEVLTLDVRVRATADVLVPTSTHRCQDDGSSWHRAAGYRMMTVWTEATSESSEVNPPMLTTASLHGAESVPGSVRVLRAGEVLAVRVTGRLSWNPKDGRALPTDLHLRPVVALVDGYTYRPLVRSTAVITVRTR
jgi:hypothetical protein